MSLGLANTQVTISTLPTFGCIQKWAAFNQHQRGREREREATEAEAAAICLEFRLGFCLESVPAVTSSKGWHGYITKQNLTLAIILPKKKIKNRPI